jgi:hypothetical protein
VLQPMKWSRGLPLQEKREVPSGMTPLPWVVLILPQRLVLPDLQSLHSLHSGLLVVLLAKVVICFDIEVDILKSNDSIAGLDIRHSGSDALDNTRAFVS